MKEEDVRNSISAIQLRNKKVEAEKAWETSWQRTWLILSITYVFMVFFMNMIWVKWAYVNAMIPTFWFFLSTLSVGFLKSKYIEKYLSK